MKKFKLAEVRDLLDKVSMEQISFSRFIEILNEKAAKQDVNQGIKLGQEPAFPVEVNIDYVEEQLSQTGPHDIMCHGMSKRFYAACAAMQGLVSHYGLAYSEQHIKEAYKLADELLKEESE